MDRDPDRAFSNLEIIAEYRVRNVRSTIEILISLIIFAFLYIGIIFIIRDQYFNATSTVSGMFLLFIFTLIAIYTHLPFLRNDIYILTPDTLEHFSKKKHVSYSLADISHIGAKLSSGNPPFLSSTLYSIYFINRRVLNIDQEGGGRELIFTLSELLDYDIKENAANNPYMPRDAIAHYSARTDNHNFRIAFFWIFLITTILLVGSHLNHIQITQIYLTLGVLSFCFFVALIFYSISYPGSDLYILTSNKIIVYSKLKCKIYSLNDVIKLNSSGPIKDMASKSIHKISFIDNHSITMPDNQESRIFVKKLSEQARHCLMNTAQNTSRI